MGPDENVAVMQRAYDAFNTGDMNTLVEVFDESAVWHLPGRSSMADDYKGRDATLAYFGQLAQETGGTFRAELTRLTADGDDRVVGIQRSTADRDGKHLDVADCIVWAVTRAPHVNIDELVVRPIAQATTRDVARKP